jgi:hypothetical protein
MNKKQTKPEGKAPSSRKKAGGVAERPAPAQVGHKERFNQLLDDAVLGVKVKPPTR